MDINRRQFLRAGGGVIALGLGALHEQRAHSPNPTPQDAFLHYFEHGGEALGNDWPERFLAKYEDNIFKKTDPLSNSQTISIGANQGKLLKEHQEKFIFGEPRGNFFEGELPTTEITEFSVAYPPSVQIRTINNYIDGDVDLFSTNRHLKEFFESYNIENFDFSIFTISTLLQMTTVRIDQDEHGQITNTTSVLIELGEANDNRNRPDIQIVGEKRNGKFYIENSYIVLDPFEAQGKKISISINSDEFDELIAIIRDMTGITAPVDLEEFVRTD